MGSRRPSPHSALPGVPDPYAPLAPAVPSLDLPTPSHQSSSQEQEPTGRANPLGAWDALLAAAAADSGEPSPAPKKRRRAAPPGTAGEPAAPLRSASGKQQRKQQPQAVAAAPVPWLPCVPVPREAPQSQQWTRAPLAPQQPHPRQASLPPLRAVAASLPLPAACGSAPAGDGPAVQLAPQVVEVAVNTPRQAALLPTAISLEPPAPPGAGCLHAAAAADQAAAVLVRELSPLERVAASLLPQPAAQALAAVVPAAAAPALTQLLASSPPEQARVAAAALLARAMQQAQQAQLLKQLLAAQGHGFAALPAAACSAPAPVASASLAEELLAHFSS